MTTNIYRYQLLKIITCPAHFTGEVQFTSTFIWLQIHTPDNKSRVEIDDLVTSIKDLDDLLDVAGNETIVCNGSGIEEDMYVILLLAYKAVQSYSTRVLKTPAAARESDKFALSLPYFR